MNQIRKLMIGNRVNLNSTLNQLERIKDNSPMLHKINDSSIRPYGLYPIVENPRYQSGSYYVASRQLKHSSSESVPNKAQLGEIRPKAYQRGSLHGTNPRQVFFYSRKRSFSNDSSSLHNGNVLMGVSKRISPYFQTVLLPKPQKYEQLESHQQSVHLPAVCLKSEREGRKLSNRRMGSRPKYEKTCVSTTEKGIEAYVITRWETFSASDEQ